MSELSVKKDKAANKNGNSIGNNGESLSVSGTCHNCGVDAKCRRRTFSEQAWTVLLLWNEISPSAVDQPICEDCYEEMRDILIDRTDEIEVAMQQSEEVAKVRAQIETFAS